MKLHETYGFHRWIMNRGVPKKMGKRWRFAFWPGLLASLETHHFHIENSRIAKRKHIWGFLKWSPKPWLSITWCNFKDHLGYCSSVFHGNVGVSPAAVEIQQLSLVSAVMRLDGAAVRAWIGGAGEGCFFTKSSSFQVSHGHCFNGRSSGSYRMEVLYHISGHILWGYSLT